MLCNVNLHFCIWNEPKPNQIIFEVNFILEVLFIFEVVFIFEIGMGIGIGISIGNGIRISIGIGRRLLNTLEHFLIMFANSIVNETSLEAKRNRRTEEEQDPALSQADALTKNVSFSSN